MTAIKYAILCPVLWAFLFGCKNVNSMKNQTGNVTIDSTETILLGGGCFWCIEAVFLGIKGVVAAEPGYAGGHVENPTYQQVCTGTTGHAEVVKVTYDPQVISLKEILEIFFLRPTIPPPLTDRVMTSVLNIVRLFIAPHRNKKKLPVK